MIIIISFVIWEIVWILWGGNFGCSEIIEKITNGNGYESCWNFGGTIWIIIGVLISVFIYKKLSKK